MPRRTARSEAASFAASLPDAYLSCRDYGHSWRAHAAGFNRKESYWTRVLRCIRCGTERVQYLSQTGAILRGNYLYPEGYQHKGLGRLDGSDRDALRLESVVRVAHDAESEAS
jgi:hypothetical protein